MVGSLSRSRARNRIEDLSRPPLTPTYEEQHNLSNSICAVTHCKLKGVALHFSNTSRWSSALITLPYYVW